MFSINNSRRKWLKAEFVAIEFYWKFCRDFGHWINILEQVHFQTEKWTLRRRHRWSLRRSMVSRYLLWRRKVEQPLYPGSKTLTQAPGLLRLRRWRSLRLWTRWDRHLRLQRRHGPSQGRPPGSIRPCPWLDLQRKFRNFIDHLRWLFRTEDLALHTVIHSKFWKYQVLFKKYFNCWEDI